MSQVELDLRGTPADVICGYLQDLGGMATAPGRIVAEGWAAEVTAGEHIFRTWTVPRVLVRLDGDPERVAEVARRLKLRAFRGGG